MKKETYFINELTGEVFNTAEDCRKSEADYAKALTKKVKDIYREVERCCDNSLCGTCPFHGLVNDEAGYGTCIRSWFDRDFINSTNTGG